MKILIILSSIIFSISVTTLATTEPKNLNTVLAKSCPDLICIRRNIDLIDSEIIKLIGLRLTYVKRAGELKQGSQLIHNQARENQILANVSQLAAKNGYPASIALEIYKTLLIQSNIYEKSTKTR